MRTPALLIALATTLALVGCGEMTASMPPGGGSTSSPAPAPTSSEMADAPTPNAEDVFEDAPADPLAAGWDAALVIDPPEPEVPYPSPPPDTEPDGPLPSADGDARAHVDLVVDVMRARHPDTFAGVWTDRSAIAPLVVGVAGDADVVHEVQRDLADMGVRGATAVPVQFSARDLAAASGWMGEQLARLPAEDRHTVVTARADLENRVVLRIPVEPSEVQAAFADELRAGLGAMLDVRHEDVGITSAG